MRVKSDPTLEEDGVEVVSEKAVNPRRMPECFIDPNGLRLIVKRDPHTYSGRLAIPDKYKQMPTTGVVVAVPKTGELDFWMGKRVLWSQLSGTPVAFKDHPMFFSLQIEEIIGEITINDELQGMAGGGYDV